MISQVIDRMDLTTVHTILTLVGAFLALYVMQLISFEHEDIVDPAWLRWFRRIYLGGGALALLWSLDYSETKSWQPWPPEVGLILAWIGMLVGKAAAIHARIRREGHRRVQTLTSSSAAVITRNRN